MKHDAAMSYVKRCMYIYVPAILLTLHVWSLDSSEKDHPQDD